MARIDIDVNTVKNANYSLPSVKSRVSTAQREVSMIKWRIPEEVLDERDIRSRLERVTRELEKVAGEIERIYNVTGSSVSQYISLEQRLTDSASEFR